MMATAGRPRTLIPLMAPLTSEIAYSVRRSQRARRVRVTVDAAGEVLVTLPRKASERRAAEAVRELRPWIERRREALSRAAADVRRARWERRME